LSDQAPTPPPSPAPKKPISVLRGLFATLGVIVMVLTGGCAIAAIGSSGMLNASDMQLVALFAGPPFLIGLGIFLVATRLGRKK
jgi:hypothetical protein